MSWASAKRKVEQIFDEPSYFQRPDIPQHTPDWARLVSLDFETYWDADYTLKKMSTSEYVRDKRFKAQMMGIKVGNGKTKIIPALRIKAELSKINWATHSVLCHNTQFDGFILSHHYGVHPAFLYDTLAMARGLHNNDIGAGLDEVSIFYGGKGKTEGGLDGTLGVLNWPKALYDKVALYCANDVDEMFRIFCAMLPKMPNDEVHLIDMITRMFTSPVLRVDIPRVGKELERELERREKLMYAAVDPARYDIGGDLYDRSEWMKMLDKREREYEGVERDMHIIKKVIGSSEKFANLLRDEGVEPPIKVSDSWMKLSRDEREEKIDKKYTYAFAKDDTKFINLPNDIESWGFDLESPDDVQKMAVKQARLQALVDVRIAVKSTTNITRAERFLEAGKDGMPLPVGYAYYRAHTGRLGGNNKMNCIPGESEVLTPYGWMPIGQFDDSVQAAVWDAETRTVTFSDVKRISLDYTGPMVRAKTHSGTHDALYTPDHGIPTVTYRDRHTVVRRTAAGMVGSGDWLLPVSGMYVNPDPAFTITVPMARFAAAMQADGGIVPNSVDSSAAQFGFTKQRKITRFRELCVAANLHYTETIAGGYTKFYVKHGQAPLAMFKYFGTWLLGLSGEALAALVDEAAHWDGHVRGGSYLFSSAIKANAEWLQTAAHLVGRSAQVQEVPNFRGWNTDPDAKLWVVNVKPRAYIVNEKDRTPFSIQEGFSGSVFCLTTPTGWFMMRHNGTIHVTGNCQNLIRGGELRQSILAPKGHHMVVADSGQIEARVGAWLWGQQDLLDAFRNADEWNKSQGVARGQDRDAYCQFADLVYGYEVTTEHKLERFVGKVCVLGLSFGMGALKLQATLAKGALGGPPVFFSLEQCHSIVNAYRAKNYKIKNGWAQCTRIIEDMAAGREGALGPINWEAGKIWLPNGMCLHYPDLQKAKDENGWDAWSYHSTLKGVPIRKNIYSGIVSENLAQALARIIVMWQMLQIGKRYRCVMTTHDEVVAIAPVRSAPTCFAYMEKWMKTAPAWCSDIPLNCEGGSAVNYSK